METTQLAMLMDFENLIIGTEGIEQESRRPFFIKELINHLESNYGRVTYKKAFADWSNPKFRKYTVDMMRSGIEMQHIVRNGYNNKNYVETHIVIQTLDCIFRNPAIDTVILVTGDADFLPLISHLKAIGKHIIGLGTEGTVSSALLSSCDIFILYGAKGFYEYAGTGADKGEAIRTIRAILTANAATGMYVEDLEEALRNDMPAFNPYDFGFEDIYAFLDSLNSSIRMENVEDGTKVFWVYQPGSRGGRSSRSRSDISQEELQSMPLQDYMAQTRWYITDGPAREEILNNIYNILSDPGILMTSEALREQAAANHDVEDKPWQGTIFSLVCGSCLWEKPESNDMPLPLRKLSLFKNIRDIDDFMVGYYTSLFHKAFQERQDLNAEAMAELMHPEDVDGHLDLFERVYANMSEHRN